MLRGVVQHYYVMCSLKLRKCVVVGKSCIGELARRGSSKLFKSNVKIDGSTSIRPHIFGLWVIIMALPFFSSFFCISWPQKFFFSLLLVFEAQLSSLALMSFQ